MGELFDYAQSMRKISEEQAKRAQTALALLRTAGLPKTIEEAAILCGAMTREQFDALAHEVFTSWHVTPPSPRICKPDPEKDGAVILALRQQGRRKDVEMAAMRQEMLRAGGIEVPLWEILEGGEAAPAAPPEKRAPSSPPVAEAGGGDEVLELSPPPPPSRHARKVEPPPWIQEAPAAPQIPLWPADKPPQAPPKPKDDPPRPQIPAPRLSPAVPAEEPILLETAEGPAQKPAPPIARPAAPRHVDDEEILEERLKKLNLKIGIVGAALVLVLFLIFLTVATG